MGVCLWLTVYFRLRLIFLDAFAIFRRVLRNFSWRGVRLMFALTFVMRLFGNVSFLGLCLPFLLFD